MEAQGESTRTNPVPVNRNYRHRSRAVREGIPMTSPSSRLAQSRLANAVKAGADEDSVLGLRIRFAASRAVDAIQAIPGPLGVEDHDALLYALKKKSPDSSTGGRA